MADLIDPGLDALVTELRTFRRGSGYPDTTRMNHLFELTEALGEGVAERAFNALEHYFHEHGSDPETDIGAYFYLSGWGVGGHSIEQRRRNYRDTYLCDVSTAWRRSERGMTSLAALIRDQTEYSRPWAVISVFQTGSTFQGFLNFNLGYESWRPPVVQLNGDETDNIEFHLHRAENEDAMRNGPGTRYTSRIVLPEIALGSCKQHGKPLGRIRVVWEMPTWPVWQLQGWTTDPSIYLRMRTFRERAVEISLESSG